MMAFAFFLLWMVASLGLLALWVFRQVPASRLESSAAQRTTATPATVES
ncbi:MULTISPECIES: hypothetical protein [unclassified Caballeronia]|nr:MULTISPECIES: hypothetical protein [unclassified Caballeronia]MDR5802383.1 hypothetical protein [Caballeronia sp. LZ001]